MQYADAFKALILEMRNDKNTFSLISGQFAYLSFRLGFLKI